MARKKYNIGMAEVAARQEQNSPELLAVRKAQSEVLRAQNLTREEARRLGIGLVQSARNFYSAEAVKSGRETLRIVEPAIERLDDILLKVGNGEFGPLKAYLERQAESMLLDPTWFPGQSQKMRQYPGKLLEMARVI